MEKICNKCCRTLPLEHFSKRKFKSGLDEHIIECLEGQCKECISERKAIWRQLHPGYMNQYHAEHKVLKPLIIRVCPNCMRKFKSNQPQQIRCNKECKPMTEIRKLKLYLKEHPEIDRNSFFKGRYFHKYT
jgi:hypothetical protein